MQHRMAPHRVQTHISNRIPHYRVPTAQAASPTRGRFFTPRCYAKLSGRQMLGTVRAAAKSGAISASAKPAMPQPMRVT